MRTVKINGFNNCMKAPKDWKSEIPIEDLYVRAIRKPDGTPTLTSAWMPSKEELALLNKGCPILLTAITAGAFYPVMLEVGSPIDVAPVLGLPGGGKLN